jgi:hypothetical protein
MNEDRIAFAHVSDVHFADDPYRFQPGGHHPDLCMGLPDVMADIASWSGVPLADVGLVVTGDLSRSGSAAEFGTGDAYFTGTWPPLGGASRPCGLGLTKYHPIPGIHDHFQGRPPTPRTSWTCDLVGPSSGEVLVEFYGVDSTSGMAAVAVGPGEISPAEFDELEQQLRVNDAYHRLGPPRARVLLCHHTLQASPHGLAIGAQCLSPRSASKVRRLAGRYGIHGVLTGHTHDTLAHQHPLRGGRHGYLAEFRSAATLQGPPRNGANELWGHAVTRDAAGRLSWRSRVYSWNRHCFVRAPSHGQPVGHFPWDFPLS